MKNSIFLLLFLLSTTIAYSQHTLSATILDEETREPLIGATALLAGTNTGASSDAAGRLQLNGIPDGEQTIIFRYVGYEEQALHLSFPFSVADTAITVYLQPTGEDLEEVVVSATRSSRTIDDIPTRVEVISGEELSEKGNMKPGDIRMLLNESTGIQTQQTSATSANASIRIQGLDGKYTQIIRDGFPLYSGFSGGLGLLQIAPLDLKRVEVIKGSASTLYGGGAIAGLVNLVSKTPSETPELSFLLNGTSALGLDASAFYAQKYGKAGATAFVSYSHGTPYDPAGIGLTAIPAYDRLTINPKLFLYLNDRTTAYAGFNGTIEKRTGGDIQYIEGSGDDAHTYFEENKTGRFSTQLELDHKLSDKAYLVLKNSISYYDRQVRLPDYFFGGEQLSSYTEASYRHTGATSEWVAGLNFISDKFDEARVANGPDRGYNQTTTGAFVQNTWKALERLTLETGLRGDNHSAYGFFLLPRISVMYTFSPNLTTRIGGGLGYKAPNVFTEDAERIQFRNVLPINVNSTEAEKSFGGNLDVNYATSLLDDEVTFNVNGLLFYTRIQNPIVLAPDGNTTLRYLQPEGFLDTKGLETNIKLTYSDFKLFVGYTLADVNEHYNGRQEAYPLVARHRLNNVLMYEVEDKLRIGLEAYYYSPQHLTDGAVGKSYWLMGLMAEKMWENFSLFINFENLLDTRQTRFDTIYTGTITNPVFRDIYAPVDGFVINGGIKFRLL
ncbi:TonB-dependent receptor [Pontibacter sp. 172403-2]|uniref:TonB-dependent receptor n=1 Tax=Pontibacter rufus TaxID=2791028 RepID=UPI0018B0162E|nr:TonB-dependent receptor [Pontibacter sp. 172403-2]MBF9252855.1 TonB-dependent receptor [Pontibacter sp. 172403-2]